MTEFKRSKRSLGGHQAHLNVQISRPADLSQVTRALTRKLKQLQCRPGIADGRFASTGPTQQLTEIANSSSVPAACRIRGECVNGSTAYSNTPRCFNALRAALARRWMSYRHPSSRHVKSKRVYLDGSDRPRPARNVLQVSSTDRTAIRLTLKRLPNPRGPAGGCSPRLHCRHCGCRLIIRPGQVAWWYSWRVPPGRSRRRTSRRPIWAGSLFGWGSARSGAAWPRARCGRCPLY